MGRFTEQASSAASVVLGLLIALAAFGFTIFSGVISAIIVLVLVGGFILLMIAYAIWEAFTGNSNDDSLNQKDLDQR